LEPFTAEQHRNTANGDSIRGYGSWARGAEPLLEAAALDLGAVTVGAFL